MVDGCELAREDLNVDARPLAIQALMMTTKITIYHASDTIRSIYRCLYMLVTICCKDADQLSKPMVISPCSLACIVSLTSHTHCQRTLS